MKDNKKLERFLFEHGTLISDLCNDYYYDGEEKGRSEGKKRGYEKGYADGYSKGMEDNWAYKCGLNDAWRTAYSIVNMTMGECEKIFGEFRYFSIIAVNLSASEAMQKIKDYYERHTEHQQNELTCDDCEQDCDDRDGLCVEFKRNKKDDHEERHTNDTWSVKEVSDLLERHGII